MSGDQPLPDDDPSIGDEEFLLRKVHPSQMAEDAGVFRLTSNAFRDITDRVTGKVAVSVFVESRLLGGGATPSDLITGLEGFGVVALRVADARVLGLGVSWERNDFSFGEAHAHLNGDKTKRTTRQRLAEVCEYRDWPGGAPSGPPA